ncbi:MAG: redox-regulated ATPase YchF [FCB group bacterium]|nr:redox-regulated ATPase YchF [FCB group bacterium]
MSLQCGIIGLPNVGKSTIFNALTASGVPAENYPFCTIDPNVGRVAIPDDRPGEIAALLKPQSVIPASVEFLDIAGLVRGASRGEGLGNKFLAHIREVSAIIHVVRCYEDENVTHVEGSIDPVRDVELVETELLLRDVETVGKRIAKVEKAAKSGDRTARSELDFLNEILPELNSGVMAVKLKPDEAHRETLKSLFLLTSKPVLYVANVGEDEITSTHRGEASRRLFEYAAREGNTAVRLCGQLEMEIAAMDPEDRQLFLDEYNLPEPGLNKLIHRAGELLELETFFTVNDKEAHAWTYRKGTTAPEAAGSIHTDFQRGFIKADVYSFEDLMEYKSEQALREAGRIRQEGKDYIVQDGDVILFRFNV